MTTNPIFSELTKYRQNDQCPSRVSLQISKSPFWLLKQKFGKSKDFLYGPISTNFLSYFRPFHTIQWQNSTANEQIEDDVRGLKTQDLRLVGANESTELWRSPLTLFLLKQFYSNKKRTTGPWWWSADWSGYFPFQKRSKLESVETLNRKERK